MLKNSYSMTFKKDDPVLACMVMALAMSPMPYTWHDLGDTVILSIKNDVPPDRVYELGAMTMSVFPAVKSLMQHYRKGGKFYLRTPKKL